MGIGGYATATADDRQREIACAAAAVHATGKQFRQRQIGRPVTIFVDLSAHGDTHARAHARPPPGVDEQRIRGPGIAIAFGRLHKKSVVTDRSDNAGDAAYLAPFECGYQAPALNSWNARGFGRHGVRDDGFRAVQQCLQSSHVPVGGWIEGIPQIGLLPMARMSRRKATPRVRTP